MRLVCTNRWSVSSQNSNDVAKGARAGAKQAVHRLGWKWVNRDLVEVPCERQLRVGRRTIVVRGRVPIAMPAEPNIEEGQRECAVILDPTVDMLLAGIERAAAKILSDPDDVEARHVFTRPSMFSAIEDARRAMSQTFQLLENHRVDERVEAELGLHFYLEDFTTQERRFEYFLGPTNSGKTHAAIEVLRESQSGIYLAPLRLLALEVYERLRDYNVATSLVTGEERVLDANAQHTSSTVEMVDLSREYDVAVIDEAQMLEDEQRGWAWTLAVAAVRAKRVVLCGSEEGLRAARQLTQRLNVTLEVRQFERKNALRVVSAITFSALRPGDAVVGFSRNAVVEMQGEISRYGFSSAAIYGSLSPLVRRREAERFRSGKADVLVATDAIGLGLNLPIRRLIFATVEKYDGFRERVLSAQEIRQIAGRSGRYGMHEEGLVTALDARDVPLLQKALEAADIEAVERPIWISPTDDHLRRLGEILGTEQVGRVLQFFQERVLRDAETGLKIADLSETIQVALALELSERFLRLPFGVRCTYTRAPVTTRGKSLEILVEWGSQHADTGAVEGSELFMETTGRDRLLAFEDRSRLATLYLWLAQRFPGVYTNEIDVSLIREGIDDNIHSALLARGARSRRSEKPRARTQRTRDR